MSYQVKKLGDSLSQYLSYVSKVKMLSKEEEEKLALEWHNNGNQVAAQELMISHLPLVVKLAYGYKGYGQPIGDLISEGNIGLMKAIYKFDPSMGFRLSTYAIWWIKSYITEYILNSWSLVKAGTVLARKKLFFSLKKIKRKLGLSGSELPSDKAEIVAKELSLNVSDVNSINNFVERKDLYLDAGPKNGSNTADSNYLGLLEDKQYNPEEVYSDKQEVEINQSLIKSALNDLDDREQFIITNRFLNENSYSLNFLGEKLSISRERVRQIEAKALQKIKLSLT